MKLSELVETTQNAFSVNASDIGTVHWDKMPNCRCGGFGQDRAKGCDREGCLRLARWEARVKQTGKQE